MHRLLLAACLAALPVCAFAQPVPPHANSTSSGDQIPLFQVTNGGVIQQRSVTLDQLLGTPFGSANITGAATVGSVILGGNGPFVMICAGQSNEEGFDPGGDKTIQAGIYTTNDLVSPTAIIPAQYGTAPFNNQGGGTPGNTPATAYNNHCISFANNLRLSGLIPASKDIVIVPNFHGGQSISQWIGSGTSSPYWLELLSGLSVVGAKYPGFHLSLIDWWQGENDVSGTYGSFSAYKAAFTTLMAQWKALPSYEASVTSSPATVMLTHELAPFADNANQLRNDFLHTTAAGLFDPAMDMISTGGITESTVNPGPHIDGASQVVVGQRTFADYVRVLLTGTFSGDLSYWGSATVYPNNLSVSTGNTLVVSPDDLRSGSAEIDTNGGAVTLPPASYVASGTQVYFSAAGSATVQSTSGIQVENGGSFSTALTPAAGLWRLFVAGGTWNLESVAPRIGGMILNITTPTAGSALTISTAGSRFGLYMTNGNTVSLPFARGGVIELYNATATTTISGSTFTWDGGATTSTLTLLPGESVTLLGLGGTSWTVLGGGTHLISYTVSTLPTCNAGAKGTQYMVTDATSPAYLGTLTGGGSTVAGALCNGSAWVAH